MSRKFDSQSGNSSCGSSCGSSGKKRADDWKKAGDKKGGFQWDGSTNGTGSTGNTNTGPVGT